MTTNSKAFELFSVYGIELEYMIVDRDTLNIKPIADEIMRDKDGEIVTELEWGEIALNNELALHVLEFKTNGPKPSLTPLPELFHEAFLRVNKQLEKFNAELMPTGMHPWYDPHLDAKLWPHGDRTIYETFNRIFDCRGHGWSNLQSTHINLPFANEKEFIQLHNAIRVIMPLIPALAASTPFSEGKKSTVLDTRLSHYGNNQKKIPSISGQVIPENITGLQHYHDEILQPMYKAILPFDPDKILQYEWLNSRGAIARFDRSAIEIRVMDIQECALADMACVAAIVAVCQNLIENTDAYLHRPLSTEELRYLFDQNIKTGLRTVIDSKEYYHQFGLSNGRSLRADEVWAQLIARVENRIDSRYQIVLEKILQQGNLSERLLRAVKSLNDLKPVYRELCGCLVENRLFES